MPPASSQTVRWVVQALGGHRLGVAEAFEPLGVGGFEGGGEAAEPGGVGLPAFEAGQALDYPRHGRRGGEPARKLQHPAGERDLLRRGRARAARAQVVGVKEPAHLGHVADDAGGDLALVEVAQPGRRQPVQRVGQAAEHERARIALIGRHRRQAVRQVEFARSRGSGAVRLPAPPPSGW